MSVLLKSVIINTAISGGLIFGSLHYLGNHHHEVFKEFYDKHKKPSHPLPVMACPYVVYPSGAKHSAKPASTPVYPPKK